MTGAFIAETSPMIAVDLEAILTDLGLSVVGVSANPDDAIATIANGGIDVAIIDYKWFCETNTLVIEALRAKSIPFAVCSGMPNVLQNSR